ncbi:hypothetical protein ACVMAJ_000139 [Bradyrhizobium sp. USDA 4448]
MRTILVLFGLTGELFEILHGRLIGYERDCPTSQSKLMFKLPKFGEVIDQRTLSFGLQY